VAIGERLIKSPILRGWESVDPMSFAPRAQSGHADVWFADLADPTFDQGAEHLDSTELARAARFAGVGLRQRYERAHSALRRLLGAYTKSAPHTLAFRSGAHGKPYLPHHRLEFNMSHSGNLWMVAVGMDPLGVDIEAVTDPAPHEAAPLAFDSDELAALRGTHADQRDAFFFRMRVRKEAVLKALGRGFWQDPRELNATDPAGCPLAVRDDRGGGWSTLNMPEMPGIAAALTCASDVSTVHCWHWRIRDCVNRL
jgi:4'-phosphopantetheinyl transferase